MSKSGKSFMLGIAVGVALTYAYQSSTGKRGGA